MYPKRSPKYNNGNLNAMGPKKPSPKTRKKRSPKAAKPRAQWNLLLEKSLVDILHEHDTPYYRGQNGWNGEVWNEMTKMFLEKNPHVKLEKSQIQDKEKELKRDYRMLKDARMQSGVGWRESDFKLQAEPHLWDNLETSFGTRIQKFKTKAFPLYDSLAELYHGHTAEGNFNFTSTAQQFLKPDVTDIESDDDDDDARAKKKEVDIGNKDEAGPDIQMLNQKHAGVDHAKINQKNVAGPSANKPNKPKNNLKKSSGDGLVGVMERFVQIKEKEANHEATQDFSISKCIAALRTLEGFDPAQKPKAFAVFKTLVNREIFLSAVNDNDGSALAWLHMEIENLT